MTRQEFIDSVIGKPYKERTYGPDYYDCWGVVVAYYREVHGVDLEQYMSGTANENWLEEISKGEWQESDEGILFMSFSADGIAKHCGLKFGNQCLHAAGWDGLGQVTLVPMRKIKRLYKDVKVYKYVAS